MPKSKFFERKSKGDYREAAELDSIEGVPGSYVLLQKKDDHVLGAVFGKVGSFGVAPFHSEVLRACSGGSPLGGGYIRFESGMLMLSGESGDYGAVPEEYKEVLENSLKETFPDLQIMIS